MVTYIVMAVVIVIAAIFLYRKKRREDMAQGLQVFDANGKVVVNMQTRISKVLGEVTIDYRDGSSGSLTDARLLDGTMWYAVTKITNPGGITALEVKANGSTLSWTQKFSTVGGYTVSDTHSLVFIYGIY